MPGESPRSLRSRERISARRRAADSSRSWQRAPSSSSAQFRSSSSTTSRSGRARTACEGACAIPTCAGRSRRTRSASCRSRPTSKTFRGASDLMVVLALVGPIDVDQVAHLVQPAVDAGADALLEVFGALSVGPEFPARGARARIIRGQQRGAPGVVADADDLVEHALLELAVLAALADLVDGQHVDLPQRLQPLARGEAAGEAVADVGEQEEEFLVPPPHSLAGGELAQHGAEQVRLPAAGWSAEEQRALSRSAGHELVDEAAGARPRDLLVGAHPLVPLQRPVEELQGQAQAGEEREPARVGAAEQPRTIS